MLILGIESSCDDTGLALYDTEQGLLAQAVHSQVQMHERYGGVVPELASRDHIRRVLPLLTQILSEAQVPRDAIGAIAFTQGPGLSGALLVGAACAQGLAIGLQRPALGIHHLEGHLLSPLLATPAPKFPFVCLLVSGGHTQLMQVKALGDYELLGETVDDAAGEAFDKSAKLMGLGYPGGPEIARLATAGQAGRFNLPRPKLHSDDLDFSFSGLKTAVLTAIRRDQLGPSDWPDLAAEIERAIIDVLERKCIKALTQTGIRRLVVAGGVSANLRLRERLQRACDAIEAEVFFPPLALCADNGAMIALAAGLKIEAWESQGVDWRANYANRQGDFDVRPRWPLAELTR